MHIYYEKDSMVSEGLDKCWIDDIRFEYTCADDAGCTTTLDCGNPEYAYYNGVDLGGGDTGGGGGDTGSDT